MATSRIDKWFSEEPRRPPAEIACLLARDRFWRDERRRLIATPPDWPEVPELLLDLNAEFAHAFVMVLSRLPAVGRRDFADTFYGRRHSGATWLPEDDRRRLALGAAIVLTLADAVDDPELYEERTLDLLRGAAQEDDLTRTPTAAVAEVGKRIARIRRRFELADPTEPRGAAALALAEVLDPSSGVVDVKEVLARSAWAVVETRGAPGALPFLLEVDRLLSEV
jgi:hypothetical protein